MHRRFHAARQTPCTIVLKERKAQNRDSRPLCGRCFPDILGWQLIMRVSCNLKNQIDGWPPTNVGGFQTERPCISIARSLAGSDGLLQKLPQYGRPQVHRTAQKNKVFAILVPRGRLAFFRKRRRGPLATAERIPENRVSNILTGWGINQAVTTYWYWCQGRGPDTTLFLIPPHPDPPPKGEREMLMA